ncbi:unnamed protein product [Allacma fusca]|uniref:Uncharacterized protein n=1 Tax=Allacma fusca TaxID=39272 RepID=A0A8J2NIM2_9HEXA|nr:unnamed protein product [Allacma fusca]
MKCSVSVRSYHCILSLVFHLIFNATLLEAGTADNDVTVKPGRNPIQIHMNYTATRDLKDFADKVHATLIKWYPRLADELSLSPSTPIKRISITFDPVYERVTYLTGNKIVGGVKYYRTHQDDVGSMIYTLIRYIQDYKNGPDWLAQGIADYLRFYIFEPHHLLDIPSPKDKYTDGYRVTAYFLNYLVNKFNMTQDIVYWLNKHCREGTYSSTIWVTFLDETVDELWADMMTSLAPIIDIDYSAAPDLKSLARNINSTLSSFYPIVVNALKTANFVPRKYFKIIFDGKYDGVVHWNGNQIVGGVPYYRTHQDDIGSMVYMMIRLIQDYKNGPRWLTQGIADYWRFYHYEDSRIPKPSIPGRHSKYTDGSQAAAYLLHYLERKYGKKFLDKLNQACREGNYSDEIWPKLFGGKTINNLWNEMMKYESDIHIGNNRFTYRRHITRHQQRTSFKIDYF